MGSYGWKIRPGGVANQSLVGGDGAELAPMGEQDSVIRDNRKEGWVK
jgi:hypothetical protein